MIIPEATLRAIKCGPVPVVRDWRKLPLDKLTRAERVMRFIEMYCKIPEGDLIGKPIKLDIYQIVFIYSVYDNPSTTRRAFLSVARKNAKTATIACLMLAHICGPEAKLNSRLVSGAMSREQAGEVYNYASKVIMLSQELSKVTRIIPSGKRIHGLKKNTEYQAVSADGKTNQGKSPVLAILDEVGQIRGPNSEFVDAITTAQGAYDDAMLFAISTQAPNDNDMFSIWLDDAAESKDQRIVSHVYAADADCDLNDSKQWYYANPALNKFRSLKDVEEQMDRALRMPSFEPTARNLILNQRVEMSAPFISRTIWLNNGGDIDEEVFKHNPVYAGIDLSAKNDLTALAMIAHDGEKWHVKMVFWTPDDTLYERSKRDRAPYDVWNKQGFLRSIPGKSIDYEQVAKEIADELSCCNVESVAFDRWRFDLLKKELDEIGVELPLIPYGQGYKDMSPALETMETLLLNEQIRHGNDPVLTMCMANSRVDSDAAGNKKLNKAKATGRIDGAIALAMAFGVTVQQQDEGKFDDFLLNPVVMI